MIRCSWSGTFILLLTSPRTLTVRLATGDPSRLHVRSQLHMLSLSLTPSLLSLLTLPPVKNSSWQIVAAQSLLPIGGLIPRKTIDLTFGILALLNLLIPMPWLPLRLVTLYSGLVLSPGEATPPTCKSPVPSTLATLNNNLLPSPLF